MDATLFFKNVKKEKLIEMLEKATQEMFGITDKKETKQPTEKAKKLLKVITEDCNFDCSEKNVIKLVEEITGEDLLNFYEKEHNRVNDDEAVLLAAFIVIDNITDGFKKNDIGIFTEVDNDNGSHRIINVRTNEKWDICDLEGIRVASTDQIIESIKKLSK